MTGGKQEEVSDLLGDHSNKICLYCDTHLAVL